MHDRLEVSVVVESYNHGEGTNLGLLERSLQAATKMVREHGRGQVLLADTSADPQVLALWKEQFPEVTRVEAAGLDYDRAKAQAARQAAGDYVLYLDGDCVAEPGWIEHHLELLRTGEADATGGFTRYEGGFLAALMSVMDFGFLIPRRERVLQCYASNNAGFRREVLIDIPAPEGPMRCRCYPHAQMLLRNGKVIKMAPQAVVLHALPPFFPERIRRGYDLIAACWINPELPEAGWLRLGVLAAPLFFASEVYLDWRRLWQGRGDVGLRGWRLILALPLFPVLRLVDQIGILSAFSRRGRRFARTLWSQCASHEDLS